MKIVWRYDNGNLCMYDTITSNVSTWSQGNSYHLSVGSISKVRIGSQNEMEKLFNDIVAAEKRGDKVFEIK